MDKTVRAAAVAAMLAWPCATAWAGLDEGRQAFERRDFAAALKALQPLADSNPDAQMMLGVMHLGGMAVPRDVEKGIALIRKAAAQEHARALDILGQLHLQGRMLPRDEAEAARLFRRAADAYRSKAEQGDAGAQNNLAALYVQGRGVERNEAEAAKWLRKAAEGGHVSAQSNLGTAYAQGRGVERNDAEAVRWYRRAAAQREIDAQYLLGTMYAQGRGIEKDEVWALVWYRKAADQGHGPARAAAGTLERRGAPSPGSLRPADPAGAEGVFSNAPHRWSIAVPAGWKVEDTDPADVRLRSPDGHAQCGVHSAAVRFGTVEEYVAFMQSFNEQYFKRRGMALRSLPAERRTLPGGTAGIEVVTEIDPGARSRRLYVLVAPVGHLVDCETYAAAWASYESYFTRILASFSAGKP